VGWLIWFFYDRVENLVDLAIINVMIGSVCKIVLDRHIDH